MLNFFFWGGGKVKCLILCFKSIWQDPKTRYPVVVRFNKVNYANVSTNNYALDEIEEVKWVMIGIVIVIVIFLLF